MVNPAAAQRIALASKRSILVAAMPILRFPNALTRYVTSPRGKDFKGLHYHAKIMPWYLPVWFLDELRQCRALCHQSVDQATVDSRYKQYQHTKRAMPP